MLERRALENYVSAEAIKKVCCDPNGRALGAFERIEDAQAGWSKAQVPHLIAAMDWSEIAKTDLGEFLTDVADAVKAGAQRISAGANLDRKG